MRSLYTVKLQFILHTNRRPVSLLIIAVPWISRYPTLHHLYKCVNFIPICRYIHLLIIFKLAIFTCGDGSWTYKRKELIISRAWKIHLSITLMTDFGCRVWIMWNLSCIFLVLPYPCYAGRVEIFLIFEDFANFSEILLICYALIYQPYSLLSFNWLRNKTAHYDNRENMSASTMSELL